MPMSDPTPRVFDIYGAPMGRYTGPDYLEGKVYLRRIQIDSGGYDSGGAYWGIGAPLYYAEDAAGNSQFFRAANRERAKEILWNKFPELRFYR